MQPDILRFPNLEPHKKYEVTSEVYANKDGEVHLLVDHLGCQLSKLVIVDPETGKLKADYQNKHP